MKHFLTIAMLAVLLTGSSVFTYAEYAYANADDSNQAVATDSSSRHGDN